MSNVQNSPTRVTTGKARLSYTHVDQPFAQQQGQDPKYSVTVLVPKSDAATKAAIDAAIAAAIQSGAAKFGAQWPPQPHICVHDGDGARPSDGMPFAPECKGHWVFTASSKQAPGLVDAQLQPIIDKNEIYSGCYGRVNVSFYAYNAAGRKGIGCGLNHVQKLADGEPLGNRVSVEEAFGAPMAAAPAAPQAYPMQAPTAPAAPQANDNPFAVPGSSGYFGQ